MWEARIAIFLLRWHFLHHAVLKGQRIKETLSSILAGLSAFTSPEGKAASAGPEERRDPHPQRHSGPGVSTGPAEGRQYTQGPGAPVRGSAAGVTGEAAHGRQRSSGGAARGAVPEVGRRAAASTSLL